MRAAFKTLSTDLSLEDSAESTLLAERCHASAKGSFEFQAGFAESTTYEVASNQFGHRVLGSRVGSGSAELRFERSGE